MVTEYNRKLILEDGSEYYGYAFGEVSQRVCELVFNTSMTGYQEILSDPSYAGQAVVMTYPLIGNYGMAEDDYETELPVIGALIVREYNDAPSNFRSTAALGEVMKRYHIPGVWGIDTRKLTRSIRDYGSRKVLLAEASMPLAEGLSLLAESTLPTDSVARVSCKSIWTANPEADGFHVVAIDCGMKKYRAVPVPAGLPRDRGTVEYGGCRDKGARSGRDSDFQRAGQSGGRGADHRDGEGAAGDCPGVRDLSGTPDYFTCLRSQNL